LRSNHIEVKNKVDLSGLRNLTATTENQIYGATEMPQKENVIGIQTLQDI
jgi:hypothetical protein